MRVSLLGDHALVIEYDEQLSASVGSWMPSHASAVPESLVTPGGATIHVRGGDIALEARAEPAPTLTLGGVSATFTTADTVRLVVPSGGVATIDLLTLEATVLLPTHGTAVDLGTMLTIASALLLNRLGAALVHAGAVVDPDGRAWVIAGDTHAGKTTTCITLVSAGWRYLSDDQVVLRRTGGGDDVVAEGWPRTAHVDGGWPEGRVTSVRSDVDMRARWPGLLIASAPMGGVILPNVEGDLPTIVSRVSSGASLTGIIRQSPWLMADVVAAPAVLSLLTAAAALPAFSLRHGLDTYGQGPALRLLVEAAMNLLSSRAQSRDLHFPIG